MELSPQQKQRLKALYLDDQRITTEDALSSVESPVELWCLSLLNVWDFPSDFLLFLDHPHCSLGQALAMYWSLSPGWLRKKRQSGRPLSESQEHEQGILERLEKAVSQQSLIADGVFFDPQRWIEERSLRHVDYAPKFMLQSASGDQVPHDLGWVEDL